LITGDLSSELTNPKGLGKIEEGAGNTLAPFSVYGEMRIMLVYLSQPMSACKIDGQPVYGKYFARGSFGPTNIPKATYLKNKDILEEFVITSEWLSRKFGKEFPSIAFTPSTFWTIDFQLVIEVARVLGIDYKSRGNKEYSDIEKRALRRSVLSRIEGTDEPD
jgi:hypothetical protein